MRKHLDLCRTSLGLSDSTGSVLSRLGRPEPLLLRRFFCGSALSLFTLNRPSPEPVQASKAPSSKRWPAHAYQYNTELDPPEWVLAAEALAQTLRRCGCAAATHVARPALATAVAPLEDESSGEEDTENHAAACAAVGFARSALSPEALWVVTQETLYHDAAHLNPAQAARRVRREDRRAAERVPRRSVVPPKDQGLRDALRAFDPSLLDEDAERQLCRERKRLRTAWFFAC